MTGRAASYESRPTGEQLKLRATTRAARPRKRFAAKCRDTFHSVTAGAFVPSGAALRIVGNVTTITSGDAVLADLQRDGYAVVERLLTPAQVATVRDGLQSFLDRTPTGRNDFEGYLTQRIYALFAKTRAFDDLAVHPLLLDVLDRTLGPSYQLSAPTGIHIGPGEKAQVLHTDDGIYPLPRPHPEVVLNTMWALDEFTSDNGATRVVPGSHRWVDRHPVDPDETVTVTMPAGSVLFILGSLWHGGGANGTDRPRLGVLLEYAAGWLRPQENHVLAVPQDVVRHLPPRLQELLGYNIHPPFVGYVDGRHPRRLLDPSA